MWNVIVLFAYTAFTKSANSIGADFRFEVPGQSSVGLIGGGRGQWLGGGTMASAEHEPKRGFGAEAPWSWKHFGHWTSNGAGKFSPISQI